MSRGDLPSATARISPSSRSTRSPPAADLAGLPVVLAVVDGRTAHRDAGP